MLNFFREGFWALQQHFRGRELDAFDGFRAGVALGVLVGLIWLIGLFLFTLL